MTVRRTSPRPQRWGRAGRERNRGPPASTGVRWAGSLDEGCLRPWRPPTRREEIPILQGTGPERRREGLLQGCRAAPRRPPPPRALPAPARLSRPFSPLCSFLRLLQLFFSQSSGPQLCFSGLLRSFLVRYRWCSGRGGARPAACRPQPTPAAARSRPGAGPRGRGQGREGLATGAGPDTVRRGPPRCHRLSGCAPHGHAPAWQPRPLLTCESSASGGGK